MQKLINLFLRFALLALCGASAIQSQEPPLAESDAAFEKRLQKISKHDPMLKVMWAPGNTHLLTASRNAVTSWDWQTGRENWRFEGNWSNQTRFAFGPKAELLAIGSGRQLELRELPTGGLIARHELAANDRIRVVAVSKRSQVAVGTQNGELCTWKPGSRDLLVCLQVHDSSIRAVAFDDANRRIFSAARGAIGISDVDRQSQAPRVRSNWGDLSSLAISADGSWLALGSAGGKLWLGRSEAIAEAELLASDLHSIASLRFSQDGALLVAGDYSGRLDTWYVETRRRSDLVFKGHTQTVIGLDIDPQSKMLASSSGDGKTRIWSLANGEMIGEVEGNARQIVETALSPDGQWLGIAARPSSVFLWDLETGQERFRLVDEPASELLASRQQITAMALGSAGTWLAIGYRSGGLQLIRRDGGGDTGLVTNPFLSSRRSAITSLAFNSTGTQLAIGFQDGSLSLWNGSLSLWNTGDATREEINLSEEDSAIVALAFESENVLVLATRDGKLSRRNTDDNEQIEATEILGGSVALAVDPRHGLLVTTTKGDILSWGVGEDTPSPLANLGFKTADRTLSMGGMHRVWVDKSRMIHVEKLSDNATEYIEAMKLVSGAHSTWVSCRPAGRCLRQDDGSLWLSEEDGRLGVTAPAKGASTDQLDIRVEADELTVSNGNSKPIEVTITNRSQFPAHWLRLRRVGEDTEGGLIFVSSEMERRLEPNQTITLVGSVSVHSSFKWPQESSSDLRLELLMGDQRIPIGSIEVHSPTPELRLKKVDWDEARGQLELTLANVGGAEFPIASLQLKDQDDVVADVDVGPIKPSAEEVLEVTLPPAVEFEDGKLLLVAHGLEPPIHRWEFRVHASRSFGVVLGLLVTFLLLAGLIWWFYGRHFLDPLVVRLTREPRELLNLPGDQLDRVRKALSRTKRLDGLLGQLGIQRTALDDAIGILKAETPQSRYSWLAAHMGFQPTEPVDEKRQRWRLQLGEDFPLNLTQCLLDLPPSGTTSETIFAGLEAQSETEKEITLILSSDMKVQNQLSRMTGVENSWVAPTSSELTELLLGANPRESLARIIGRHVPATLVSPYQLGQGVKKPTMFFGRESQLNQIQNGTPSNYLLVGARQVGKSSMMKELKRRLDREPNVVCHYFVLNDNALIQRLAGCLGITKDEPAASDIREYLDSVDERHVVLVDELDSYISQEDGAGYEGLNLLRSLSEEEKCHFVLAGFWELFRATHIKYDSPVRNFGETIEIGALEDEACRRLIEEPMGRMNITFGEEAIVSRMIERTGRRPNLISIICHEIIRELGLERRVISMEDLETACKSSKVNDALKVGTLDQTAGLLEKEISFLTVEDDEFSIAELKARLARKDPAVSEEAIEEAVRRMQLACVFRPLGDGRYTYQVPLYREMIRSLKMEST